MSFQDSAMAVIVAASVTASAKLPRKKKCKECRETFQPTRSIQPCCGFKCALVYATNHAKKKAADRSLQEVKRIKQDAREARNAKNYVKENDYRKQFDLTKKQIQKWVNHVRDAGKPCISCSTTSNVVYCGSHYRTAGGNSEIALDTRNIHRACNRYCNKALSGNISGNKTSHGYIVGLVNRYGQDYVDWLDGYHEPKKYTCEQLREIRSYYARLTREGIKDDADRPHK